MDVLAYFGFTDRPFVLAPVASHYLATDPDPARAMLDVIVRRRGLGMCTGAHGLGKSMVARYVLSQLPSQDNVATLVIPIRVQPDADRFLMRVAQGLGVQVQGSAGDVLDALIATLQQAALEQKNIALLVDDAHVLLADAACAQQLRGLLNLDDPHRGGHLLNVLLFGMPELASIIAADAALATRVSEQVVLRPWKNAETRRFLTARLQAAHAREGMFDNDVMHLIHDFSAGIPADVVRYADALLQLMFERKIGVANVTMMDEVLV